MKPQSAKSKGRRLQQKIVADILKSFPHLKADDCVSTSMGCGGEDVKLSTAARQSLPLSIEAKNQEKISIWSCLEQCEANAPTGATPCLIFHKNNSKTYATLPWESLLDLYRRLDAGSAAQVPPRLGQLLREIATFAPEDTACASSPTP